MSLFDREDFERTTVSLMIDYYCRKHHHTERLCDTCHGLKEYTLGRIKNCVLLPGKPVCSACHIHCYNPGMREEIRKIMRYSGPGMIYLHPIRAIVYMIIKKKNLKALNL